MTMLELARIAVAAAALAAPPATPIPRDPARLARTLTVTSASLDASIDRWLAAGTPSTGPPPKDVNLEALYQQRIYRLLGRDTGLAHAVIPRLPRRLAATARDVVLARRELGRITPPAHLRAIRTGPPRPAGVLLRFYREGERRFGVRWQVLAAVNFVESDFGRVRSRSAAGAQGPMQFLPSTWHTYGLGGDVHDPHDAILGAANFLRAAGAPGSYRLALHAYNPSWPYVDAVLRYARQIGTDRRAYFAYYSWQVFVRTASGERRVTGPGLR